MRTRCPDDTTLAAFIDGTLEPARFQELERHLAECSQCREVSAALVVGPESESSAASHLGRYRLDELIGQGSMGLVYRAHDLELDREVAIKVLHAPYGGGADDTLMRLMREAQSMARISHPNVVQVFDVDRHAEELYVVMELIDGPDLQTWTNEERPWTKVLEVYIEAGRGLAAAHAAGVLHRDFKPANVLLGPGGSKVSDFGLARSFGDPTTSQDLGNASHSGTVGATPKLRSRRAMLTGTPAYMAPEQWEGRVIDARADQFSFCVCLYEALCGTRPFDAPTVAALARRVAEGDPDPWPRASDVPARIRRAVLRGLSHDPAERFADMRALLDELAVVRTGRRKIFASVVSVAVLAGVVAVGQVSRARECVPSPSNAFGERERDALRAEFDRVGATNAWPIVERELHRRSEVLHAARTDACRLGALPRGKAQCLDAAQAELSAFATALQRMDADRASRSAVAVRRLPDPSQCRDDAASIAPRGDRWLGELWPELAAVRTALALGDYDRAVNTAASLVEDARDVGAAPMVAEAQLALGKAQVKAGAFGDAVRSLSAAHDAARAARLENVAARAATELVFVHADRLDDLDAAQAWLRHAWAAIEASPSATTGMRVALLRQESSLRTQQGDLVRGHALAARALGIAAAEPGFDPVEYALTLNRVANASSDLGDFDRALGHYRAADELFRSALGDEHPFVGTSQRNIGLLYEDLGRLEDAQAAHEKSFAIRSRALGEDHLDVGRALTGLGRVLWLQGDLDAARDRLEQSLIIKRKHLGSNHTSVALTLNILGVVHHDAGRRDEALDAYVEAARIREVVRGDADPGLANALGNIAALHAEAGRYEEAIINDERAVEILTKAYGPGHPRVATAKAGLALDLQQAGHAKRGDALLQEAVDTLEATLEPGHPDLVTTYINIGANHAQAGRFEAAEPFYRRAVDATEQGQGERTLDLAFALTGHGEVLLELGQREQALLELERAMKLREGATEDPFLLGETRFALARALASDDPRRAAELARTAHTELTQSGPRGKPLLHQLGTVFKFSN